MIEISENLHRSELSVVEKSDLTARWIELEQERVKNKQSVADASCVSGGEPVRRKDGRIAPPANKPSGVREAAKALGIDRDAARRAVKIASLSSEEPTNRTLNICNNWLAKLPIHDQRRRAPIAKTPQPTLVRGAQS